MRQTPTIFPTPKDTGRSPHLSAACGYVRQVRIGGRDLPHNGLAGRDEGSGQGDGAEKLGNGGEPTNGDLRRLVAADGGERSRCRAERHGGPPGCGGPRFVRAEPEGIRGSARNARCERRWRNVRASALARYSGSLHRLRGCELRLPTGRGNRRRPKHQHPPLLDPNRMPTTSARAIGRWSSWAASRVDALQQQGVVTAPAGRLRSAAPGRSGGRR